MDKKAMTRQRRSARVRYKVRGSKDRPRLCVFKSNKYLYVQAINDDAARTIASGFVRGKTREDAQNLGRDIAIKLKKEKVSRIMFDRGKYRYHGRVKDIADSMREGGLSF